MHICYISHEYPLWATGGIGSFIQTIGRGLVKNGHHVTVVGIGDKPREEVLIDQGVIIYRLPSPSILRKATFMENSWRVRKKINHLHEANPVDVVETAEQAMFMLPRSTPYRKVIRMHGGHHFFAESEKRPVDKWKGFLERLSFRNADGFVAVSEHVKKHTAKYLSTSTRPVVNIRYPVDEKVFRQANLSLAIPRRLVFAGTVCEKKGIRQLIESLAVVIPGFPDVQLDVYGRDWFFNNGDSYTAYLKSHFSPEIMSHVNFHGPVSLANVPSAYELAELCVFPSHMETQGLVAPEAMIMGKPVLFSSTGPGPETIRHMETGLLCNPLDPSDIAQQIIFAFNNPSKMMEIALEGQKHAKQEFNVDLILERNIAFYASLM